MNDAGAEMLKSAYIAPDEFTAITIREMLKGMGITAEIRRFETAWLDGLPKFMKGGWGEVLVDDEDVVAALQYIKEFLESPPTQSESEGEGESGLENNAN